MEIKIANNSRIMLEKVDNGVILYDISSDGEVSSRVVYEIYFKDGSLNFEAIADMFDDVMEDLRLPVSEETTNSKVQLVIVPLDPDKPVTGITEDDDDDDDED
jgi:hypothetical protein